VQHRPELERFLLTAVGRDVDSVLDLGCGVGRTGFLLWENEIGRTRVGAELDPEYVERARSLGVYDRVDELDVTNGLGAFEDDSFDAVLCVQLLTVLDKSDGRRLLAEAERVARKRVVAVVELRKELRTRDRPNENDRSLWTLSDLHELGYRTQPFSSRAASGLAGGRKFMLTFYGGTLVSQVFPRFAGEAIAVKELG
jgi:SAM-dependent methyltransferase